MDDNRIIFKEEKEIVKKVDKGETLSLEELKIYLKQYVRNKDYYIKKLCDEFNEPWVDIILYGCLIALIVAVVAVFGSIVDSIDYANWISHVWWRWFATAGLIAVGSTSVGLFGSRNSKAKAEMTFSENVQDMQETISRAKAVDRKKEAELLLKPDEIPDKFIKDIHELMDDAIESRYDNYLSDCAILRQLESRYLDVKKSLEDGSEENIIARFPMFYRVYFSMQRSIKEEIMRAKNQNVNTLASKEFLDDSGLEFSEEMLAQASLRIDELATASVGEPELHLARAQKGLSAAQK